MTRKKSDPLADSLVSSLLDDSESEFDLNAVRNVASPSRVKRARNTVEPPPHDLEFKISSEDAEALEISREDDVDFAGRAIQSNVLNPEVKLPPNPASQTQSAVTLASSTSTDMVAQPPHSRPIGEASATKKSNDTFSGSADNLELAPEADGNLDDLNFTGAKFQGKTVVHKLAKLEAEKASKNAKSGSENLQPSHSEELLPKVDFQAQSVALPQFSIGKAKGRSDVNALMHNALAAKLSPKSIPAEPKPAEVKPPVAEPIPQVAVEKSKGAVVTEPVSLASKESNKESSKVETKSSLEDSRLHQFGDEKTRIVPFPKVGQAVGHSSQQATTQPFSPDTISKTQNIRESGQQKAAAGNPSGGFGGSGSGSGSGGSGSDDHSGKRDGSKSSLERAQQLLQIQTYAKDLAKRLEEMEIIKVRQDSEIFSLKKRWFELKSEKEETDNQLLNERERFKAELERRDAEIKTQKRKLDAAQEAMDERERDLQSQFRRLIASEARLKDRLNSQQAEHRAVLKEKEKRLRDLEMHLEEIRDEKDLSSQESRRHSLKLKEQQESVRRAVRAMRMALQSLDGNESMKSESTTKKTG